MKRRLNVARLSCTILVPGILLALAACGASQPPVPGAPPAAVAGTPWHSISTGLRAPANTPQEMCHTTLVAVGTVGALGQAHWNTPTGQRSAALTDMQIQAQGYTIYTPVSFGAFLPLLDHRSQATLEYDLSGGQVGADSLVDEDAPSLKPGGRYLVVFTPSLVAGGASTQRNLLIYDAFPIDAQDNVLLKPQIVEQGQVSQQAVVMSLSDLTTQLAACK